MIRPVNTQQIIETIAKAGRDRKVLLVEAKEFDGTIEKREVEPYSFRPKGTTEKFFFYCLLHNGIRNFRVMNIIEVRITDKTFVPRYEVEF